MADKQNKIKIKKLTMGENLAKLDNILSDKKDFLILLHNYPDPDAIASAAALGYIAEQRSTVKASIAYGGNIGRVENRTLINKLNIHLKEINRVRLNKYDCFALVDGQPKASNTPDIHYHIVIDHHPQRKDTKADLVIIKPGIGVTASIMVSWLEQCNLEIPSNLATALTYAISSETQDLGREATQEDISAYLTVFTKCSLRKLSQILHPKLPHSYFIALTKTMNRTYTFRNLICAHMGKIPNLEIVPEMADFLLKHRQKSWALTTGSYKNQLVISIRSSNRDAKAGEFIKKLVGNPDTVGGHDMIAGGYIPIDNESQKRIAKLEQDLSRKFASLQGYDNADWKPLIDTEELIKEKSKTTDIND